MESLLKQFLLGSCFDFPDEFNEICQKVSSPRICLGHHNRQSWKHASEMHASEIQEVCDDVVLLQPTIVYKPICSSVFINSIYRNIHSKAKFIGIEISSTPHIVWALWNEQYYGPPPTDVNLHPKFNERPVCVSTIMLHLHVLSFTCTSRSVVLVDNSVNENQQEWTLAHVSWPIQNDIN